MKSKDFLEQVKRKYDLHSNYALAKMLKMSQSRVSMYMREKREFDNATAIEVSLLLGEGPLYIRMMLEAERAKRTKYERTWLALAEMAKKQRAAMFAVLLALVALGGPVSDATAAGIERGREYTLYA